MAGGIGAQHDLDQILGSDRRLHAKARMIDKPRRQPKAPPRPVAHRSARPQKAARPAGHQAHGLGCQVGGKAQHIGQDGGQIFPLMRHDLHRICGRLGHDLGTRKRQAMGGGQCGKDLGHIGRGAAHG